MAYNGKTNWQLNEIVKPEDMNRIEQGIYDLEAQKIAKDATLVLTGGDLNTCTRVGLYTWSASNASAIANCPEVSQGTMFVIPRLLNYTGSVENITQFIITQGNNIYTRTLADGVWSSWVRVSKMSDLFTVAKYNPVSGTKTAVSSTTSTANPLPTQWNLVVSGTSYEANGFKVKASSYIGTGFVYYAFDNNSATSWQGASASTDWVMIELPNPLEVRKFTLRTNNSDTNAQVIIEGSNDGSAWTDLISSNILSGTNTTQLDIASAYSAEYKYYRLRFTFTAICPKLLEASISSSLIKTYSTRYSLAGAPSSWEQNQRVLIQTPATPDTSGVVENVFAGISVSAILQNSRKYELVYNTNKFDVMEVD